MRCIGRMCRRWMKTNWRRVRRRCPSRLRRCRGSPGRCPQGVLLAVFILLWFDLSGSDAREVPQFSTRERRVAGLRCGRLRPARPVGSQELRHQHRPILVSGCGIRPGHQRCPAASPAVLRTAKARPIRPRRAPHVPLMRRPRRGRRFPSESRYSLSVQAVEACGA